MEKNDDGPWPTIGFWASYFQTKRMYKYPPEIKCDQLEKTPLPIYIYRLFFHRYIHLHLHNLKVIIQPATFDYRKIKRIIFFERSPPWRTILT